VWRRSCPVASTGVSGPLSPVGDSSGTGGEVENQERAAAALRAAFERLAPQGSDAWNFLAAFTHLGDRYGPYQPGASGLSELLRQPEPPSRRARRMARLIPGQAKAASEGSETELDLAMAQVVEAFRFLSARVTALEERLAGEDRPVDGPSWLVPAAELGEWVGPVVAHIVSHAPSGAVLHGDSGKGALLDALSDAGVSALGVEPRGGVALQALERGCSVTINEVLDDLAGRPAGSLGGVVLSGVVDRLPLHALLPLLSHARRTLPLGAPIVVVASEPSAASAAWQKPALDLIDGRPLHAETWEVLLDRAGFVDIAPLPPNGAADRRFVVVASTPA